MIKLIRRFRRLTQITRIFWRFGLDEWFPLLTRLRYLNPFTAWSGITPTLKSLSRGERLRLALEQLGPLFVKLGQLLSTRRDWVPTEVADELAKLQDQVPPFPAEQACALIEAALQAPITSLFAEFDQQPIASASIAQVHAARLLTGESVVVKVLRPGIERQVARDIELLYLLAWLAGYSSALKRLRPHEVIVEFERCLQNELDLLQEAANASQLRRNLQHDDYVKIPKIYWSYTQASVLVMERIVAIPIGDPVQLQQSRVNFHVLATRLIELFFTQVFRDCFFHADLHPGNIFVSAEDPEYPLYLLVDFGIVGTLSRFDQRYLAENLVAFFKRDYQRVAKLHLESGWVPKDTHIEAFASAIRTVCEPVFDRPLRDISIAQLLLKLFQTARRFEMPIQPQLLLLQKTLFNVESLSRQLDPNLDLWATAKPFLDRWLRRQIGPRAFLGKLRAAVPQWTEKLPELPELLYQRLSTPLVISAPLQVPTKQQRYKCYSSRVIRLIGGLLILSAGLQLAAPHVLCSFLQTPLGVYGIGVVGVALLLV